MTLDFLLYLQNLRTPLWDSFFRAINFLDTPAFFFLLIPVLWFGKGWVVGLRFFSIMFLSSCLVEWTKELFAIPRPCDLLPSLCLVKVPGYSFPSGGATSAMLLSGLLVLYGKGVLKWPCALLFFLAVSFSRVYLGVHYPLDILGGWVLGLCLLLIFFFAFPPIEAWLKKQSWKMRLLFAFALPPLLAGPLSLLCFVAFGILAGLFLSFYLKVNLPSPTTTREAYLRAFFALLLSLGLFLLLTYTPLPSTLIFSLTRVFLSCFLLIFGGSLLLFLLLPHKKH